MDLLDSLEALEGAAQGNARLDKLETLDSPQLRELLNFVLDSSITFGIKKLPKLQSTFKLETEIEWLGNLRNLLKNLANRTLTGNRADEAVARFLGACNPLMLKWSERILKRDLRLNFDSKSVNKVFPNAIKVFSVPLAESYEKVKSFKGVWTLQPKLDGARCIAEIPGVVGEPVVLKSRTGKVWANFESIRKTLQLHNDSGTVAAPCRFDGEVVSMVDGKINFQALQHTLHRKDGVETGQLKYVVFDHATVEEWENPKQSYVSRLIAATLIINLMPEDNVKPVPSQTVIDPTLADLTEACKQYVAIGYEGAMLRKANQPVVMKRSKDLLKVKMFKDLEAEIIGVFEGEGRLKGMMGGMKMRLPNGNEFECGSGFDDAQRIKYWKDPPIGLFANIKYFELTNDLIPRFPIFRGLRSSDDF